MRRVVDVTILTAVLAVVGLVWASRPGPAVAVDHTAATQQSLGRLYRRTAYHAALQQTQQPEESAGWPAVVLPEWFTGELPQNPLLPDADARPWLDVAPPGDEMPHPPDPVAYRPHQAQFWYNPNLGVFRARVSSTLGEKRALELYNRVHGVELAQLSRHADPDRAPLTYTPGQGLAPPAPLAAASSSAARSAESFVVGERGHPLAPAATDRLAREPTSESPAPPRRGRARLSD